MCRVHTDGKIQHVLKTILCEKLRSGTGKEMERAPELLETTRTKTHLFLFKKGFHLWKN